jgi:hypothetical protein
MAGQLQAKADEIANAILALMDGALDNASDQVVAEMKRRATKRTGALAESIRKEKLAPLRYRIRRWRLADNERGP